MGARNCTKIFNNVSITPGPIPPLVEKRPFRWKLWLTLCSPLLIAGAIAIFLLHVRSEYIPRVDAAASLLHERMERGEDVLIYAEADPGFQSALPRDTALSFLSRVHRKLGKCQYVGPTTWGVNSTPNSTFVVIRYHESCSNGAADENLTWRIVNGSPALFGFNVNSPLLLTD